MAHTAVFAVIGAALLALAVSHPTPDYRSRSQHTDNYLRSPYVPSHVNNDAPQQQSKQLAPLATALLLTPLITGIGSSLTGLGGGLLRDTNAYVVHIPGSPVPHLYLTQTGDNSGVPSALPPASPLVNPGVVPLTQPIAAPITIPYPAFGTGSVLPQQLISNPQIIIPSLPRPDGPPKEVVKPVDESSVRAGVKESQ